MRAPLQRSAPQTAAYVWVRCSHGTLLWKYVPCRAKQLGVIERADMEIRESGQADSFAS
jgi:hypothetical protein